LTQAHEKEKRKGEDLAQALEQLGKAQDQLVVQQKMASLGTLTAGIAHEIKNPLNFVNNFAEIAASLVGDIRDSIVSQKDRLDPKEYEFVCETLGDLEQNAGKIREHGKRADGIVKGMLMHSRGQQGQVQETNLNGLVCEYIKLAYHGIRAQDINFNVTIEEAYDATIPPMRVVPHDLSRVILNIANNACYAADHKAKRVGDGFRPTLHATTSNLGEFVEIRIRDNGDGIPEHIREKIFEPFFTTKPAGSGTGLGLSMSYDIIVQEHRGEIRVESEPGEFAEFIIRLPMVKPARG
jgi:signal transduction histidine kinase